MNELNFCYWLQGLLEIGDIKSLDERQVQIVKDHLALVFQKVTPDRSHSTTPQETNLPSDLWRIFPSTTSDTIFYREDDVRPISIC